MPGGKHNCADWCICGPTGLSQIPNDTVLFAGAGHCPTPQWTVSYLSVSSITSSTAYLFYKPVLPYFYHFMTMFLTAVQILKQWAWNFQAPNHTFTHLPTFLPIYPALSFVHIITEELSIFLSKPTPIASCLLKDNAPSISSLFVESSNFPSLQDYLPKHKTHYFVILKEQPSYVTSFVSNCHNFLLLFTKNKQTNTKNKIPP